MAEQLEKSFQKQPLFHNSKVAVKKAGKERRWYKDVGLGFKVGFVNPFLGAVMKNGHEDREQERRQTNNGVMRVF